MKYIKNKLNEFLNTSSLLEDYIDINGRLYSTKNSNDEYISHNIEDIKNFYNLLEDLC